MFFPLCLQADFLGEAVYDNFPKAQQNNSSTSFFLSYYGRVLILRRYPNAVPSLILAGLCTLESYNRYCLSQYTAEYGLT